MTSSPEGEEIFAREDGKHNTIDASETDEDFGSKAQLGAQNGSDSAEDAESQSDSSSGSNSDSDGSEDENNGGMSAYEKLRLERIKRNNLRLKELGLASKEGGGILGKKKPKHRRKSKSTTNESTPAVPQRRSRRSTGQNVSYVEPSLRDVLNNSDQKLPHSTPILAVDGVEELPSKPKNCRPVKDVRNQRMARFIYDEMKRIEKHKKRMLKEAEKNRKSAETESKYWQKRASMKEKRVQKAIESERNLKQQQVEYALYGTTAKSFVNYLDRRSMEIGAKIRLYDSSRMDAEQRVEKEARRLENENRLRLLDAMDAFPKAMKESIKSLNSMLQDRAPKDPSPPRNNKRKSDESSAEVENPKKKKSKIGGNREEKEERELFTGSAAMPATTQASLSQPKPVLNTKDADGNTAVKSVEEAKAKKKRELNVGGWVSPAFAKLIDRKWLEKDKAQSHFQPKKYSPQTGDTVLYYPVGHCDFRSKFPDHLALKKISRAPLWERATKEKNMAAKRKAKEEGDETESKGKSSPTTWWTDEWLSGGRLWHYPIVCVVERSQAEFPPDPTPKVNGTWVNSDANKGAKGKKKPLLRLAVSLRPLTPLLPPEWVNSSPVDTQTLSPPPPFTAVTFPSSMPPFILPFSWAYIHNQSIAVNENIIIGGQSKVQENAKIASFETMVSQNKECFRIADKLEYVAQTLEFSASKPLVDDAKGKARPVSMIPPHDSLVIREFLSRVLSQNGIAIQNRNAQRESGGFDLVDLVRITLPLWKGVSVTRTNQKIHAVCAWELKTGTTARADEGAASSKEDFTRTLDAVLADKMILTIKDFLGATPAAGPFRALVTDEIAQYYSSAVPISMSLDRILQRLKKRYYRNVEAVVVDLTSIQNNCALYNALDSQIVASVNSLIPAAKKALSSLLSSHAREQKEKLKKRSDPSFVQASKAQRGRSKRVDPFQEPFERPLHREWLQLTVPDVPWNSDRKGLENKDPQWIPQISDSVLYSRTLHKRFVEGHVDSLATTQCFVSPLTSSVEVAEKGVEESGKTDSSKTEVVKGAATPEKMMGDGLENHAKVDQPSGEWLVGNVVSVRVEFPRVRKPESKNVGVNGAFPTDSPILAVGMQFPTIQASKTSVVYWRPCCFSFDMQSGPEHGSGSCKECGVPLSTSFLCPSFGNHWGGKHPPGMKVQRHPKTQSQGIPREEALTMKLGLDLLKRRCMSRFPSDYYDPNLTAENVMKDGYWPQLNLIGQVLPSFEDMLRKETTDGVEQLTTTQKPNPFQPELVATNFLPPWLPSGHDESEATRNAAALANSLSPLPKLCLELVLQRLKNGYYRTHTQLRMDVMEAYTTSVLLYLAPFMKRTKKEEGPPISIKKMASVLSSRKYVHPTANGVENAKKAKAAIQNGKVPISPSKKNLTKDTKKGSASPKKSKVPKSPSKIVLKKHTKKCSASPKKSKVPKSPSKKVSPNKDNKMVSAKPKKSMKMASGAKGNAPKSEPRSPDKHKKKKKPPLTLRKTVLSEEENMILARLERVRRLHAAALVVISETTHFGVLNGLLPLQVSRPLLRRQMIVFTAADEQAARARNVCTVLVAALSRDQCMNRYPMLPSYAPTMKVKITVEGEATKAEEAASNLTMPAEGPQAGVKSVPTNHQYAPPAVPHAGSSGSANLVPTNHQNSPPASPRAGSSGPAKSVPNHQFAPPAVPRAGSNAPDKSVSTSHQNVPPAAPQAGSSGPAKTVSTDHQRAPPAAPQAGSSAPDKLVSTCHQNAPPAAPQAGSSDCNRSTESTAVSRDRIFFSHNDYENDEALTRLFFSKRGRQLPCIRCQAMRKSFFECRVVKAHSNIDFDLATNFCGVGGLDGIFRRLNKLPETPKAQVATEMKPGSGARDATPAGAKDGDTTGPSSAQKSPDDEPRQSLPDGPIASGGKSAIKDNDGKKDVSKEEVDAREVFERAKAALELATELHESATKYAKAPPRLSEEFLANYYPLDEADGKYECCILCGLSGDLLCCETTRCPNTLHPKCANLAEVPKGDFFCGLCEVKAKTSIAPATENLTKAETDENALAPSSSDAKGSPGAGGSCKADEIASCCPTIQGGDKMEIQEEEVDTPTRKEQATGNTDAEKAPSDVACLPPSVACLPPVVTFDEEKSKQLTTELEQLFVLRTGRQRGKVEEAPVRKRAEKHPNKEEEPKKKEEPKKEEEETPQLGTKFQKDFGDYGIFTGTVIGLPNGEQPYYKVRYDDGDQEDLSEAELFLLLSRTRSKKVKDEAKPKRKRGRPRKEDSNAKKQHQETREAEQKDLEGGSEGVATKYNEAVNVAKPKKRGRPRKDDENRNGFDGPVPKRQKADESAARENTYKAARTLPVAVSAQGRGEEGLQ